MKLATLLILALSIATAQTRYGFYSQQAREKAGASIWSTPDGRNVEVTAVFDEPDGIGYLWPDKKLVGEVVEWVEHGVGKFRVTQSSTLLFQDTKEVEIGGLDKDGKPYLIVKGKRRACSMRALVKVVRAAKMSDSVKATALWYLGHPINLRVYAQTVEVTP
jgi:hypothetical protein